MNYDYWVIGFLWGSARFSGDYLLAQNDNKLLLEELKNRANIPNKIFQSETTTGNITYRMKINLTNGYVKILYALNHSGRVNNIYRDMPNLDQRDESEFLKGYFSTHFTLDKQKKGNPRLRFYASQNILDKLNLHLQNELNTSLKKVTNHGNNDVCKILYYQSSKEVPVIVEYLELLKYQDGS